MEAVRASGDRSATEGWAELVALVRADLSECVETTVAAARTMRSYDDVGVDAIRVLVRGSYDAVLAGLDERRRPGSGEDGSVFERAGETRGRQGVAIREMLTLWRIGLESLHDVACRLAPQRTNRDALLLEFLQLALAWDDFAMLHAAEGHRRGELSQARGQQHAQTNCVRRVLSGRASPAEIRTVVTSLGLDADGHYHAVRVRPLAGVDVEAIERHLGADGLVRRGNGLLTVVDGDACGFIAHLPQTAVPMAVGISEPVALPEMPPAFHRAGRALDTALALGIKGVFGFDDLSIHPAIATDADIGDVLVGRYITPVQAVAGGAVVLTTVEHFLANDRSVDLTAKDLDVHPNTVRQRLERFEQGTGRSLRETETLVELWWALQRRRLE